MSSHDELPVLPCREFSEFKEALQQMRAIDDRIIYKLNTSVPTVSFEGQFSAVEQCKDLYGQTIHGAVCGPPLPPIAPADLARRSVCSISLYATVSFVSGVTIKKLAATEGCPMLQSLYSGRSSAIQRCVNETSDHVLKLKDQRAMEPESPLLIKLLRKEQTMLRLMKVELGVEDVVKERSMKVFRERCWKSYKPSDL